MDGAAAGEFLWARLYAATDQGTAKASSNRVRPAWAATGTDANGVHDAGAGDLAAADQLPRCVLRLAEAGPALRHARPRLRRPVVSADGRDARRVAFPAVYRVRCFTPARQTRCRGLACGRPRSKPPGTPDRQTTPSTRPASSYSPSQASAPGRSVCCVVELMGDADAEVLGDYSMPKLVSYFFENDLQAADQATDDDLIRLLEPYRPHRFYVLTLLNRGAKPPPRRGPRRKSLRERF